MNKLKTYAAILANIRRFFSERNITEVSTPILSPSSTPDPTILSLQTTISGKPFYLQTSPEFYMKRLLCAGSDCIYQICKAFRDEESGRYHNPEFTMLEWYRVGFNHHDLMDEMDEFLKSILNTLSAERISYQNIFLKHLEFNPHTVTNETLINCAQRNNININANYDKDTWLNLLLSHLIEPKLGLDKPAFIFDYPTSQAALAKIRQDDPPVSERFEVYINGIELANGFHELTDATEQAARFHAENATRKKMGLAKIPIDEDLIAALKMGLPPCAGVALGVDRLMMLMLHEQKI